LINRQKIIKNELEEDIQNGATKNGDDIDSEALERS
jgi:DNA-binding GntR family transcriptional regulator